MNTKLIFGFFFLFLLFQESIGKSLEFPLYIIPKSKNNSSKSKTPNTFKSFVEIPKIQFSLNDKERMCLELCFGPPKSCHLLAIHPQSFLISVQDVRGNIKKNKK